MNDYAGISELTRTAITLARRGEGEFTAWFNALSQADKTYIALEASALKALPAVIEAYKIMGRPGVTFTPEQLEMINAMQDDGEYERAQKTINAIMGGAS